MPELNEKIKEHFRNPHNVREIENPEGMGTIDNAVCGDTTKLYLCAVTIASASVLTEKIRGKEISKLLSGTDEEIVKRLISLIETELGEIPPVKLHCPPATVQVFLESIARYFENEGKNELSLRAKRLIPEISEYYKRGEEKE